MIYKEKVTVNFYNPENGKNDRPMSFFLEIDTEQVVIDLCGRARRSKSHKATALSGAVTVRVAF